jgi:hypothetical protein
VIFDRNTVYTQNYEPNALVNLQRLSSQKNGFPFVQLSNSLSSVTFHDGLTFKNSNPCCLEDCEEEELNNDIHKLLDHYLVFCPAEVDTMELNEHLNLAEGSSIVMDI